MVTTPSIHHFLFLLPLPMPLAFLGPSCTRRAAGCHQDLVSIPQTKYTAGEQNYVHAKLFATDFPSERSSVGFYPDFAGQGEGDARDGDATDEKADINSLVELCNLLDATPTDLLHLESTPDGARGVYLSQHVNEGDIVLSLPLGSCLQDETPPSWMWQDEEETQASSVYSASDWATRLAASLLDLQLRQKDFDNAEICEGWAFWLDQLPDSESLKASLPVHWPEETVRSARSTALELAVDSSYFARAESVENLLFTLKSKSDLVEGWDEGKLRQMCSSALDVVQTRSCRLVLEDGTFFRVLAPIFDFINHGSMKIRGEAGANARFQLENDDGLVVRATKDIPANKEVLIDYGDSARPAWRCLLSYGFVPQYTHIPGPNEGATTESDEEDNEAEVYIDGVRYVVGPSQVPFDMVAAAFRSEQPVDEDGDGIEISLTPEVALKLADRISDVAYYMLLEPEQDMDDEDTIDTAAPFEVISAHGAASLRWSQHRVLLACALGLREFAADATSFR